MNKIQMNVEILNIINATLNYQKFICSNDRIFEDDNFDWYKQTEDYYNTLPLPKGLKHSINDFEKILDYMHQQDKLDRLNNTSYSDLHYEYF